MDIHDTNPKKKKDESSFDLDNKEDMNMFLQFLDNNYSVKFLFQDIPAKDIKDIFNDYPIDRLEKLTERFDKHQMFEHSLVIQGIIISKIKLGNLI